MASGCGDYWLSEPATTNNRMAIRSAIEGLSALRVPCRVVFVSDSEYLVKGMREWVPAWRRRGWRRKTGPVENEDFWRRLVDVAERHDVEWRWVRGHAGHPRNEYANMLAIRAAKKQGLIERSPAFRLRAVARGAAGAGLLPRLLRVRRR